MPTNNHKIKSPGASADAKLALVIACAIALAIMLATYRSVRYEDEAHLNRIRYETLQHATILRAKIEGALNSRLHLAHGLAAYATSHPGHGNLDHFEAYAAGLLNTGLPGIRSLQLAPGAVVKYVYPKAGNASIIGHDLLADPLRREAVKRTILEKLFVVAGPVKLIQGGVGLIARLPLYDNIGGVDEFWGFATVLLDVDPVLREGGLYPALSSDFQTALRGKDALGEKGDVFFGDSKIFSASPVLLDIELPHGSWQIAVVPTEGWPESGSASPYIWIAGILLAYFASSFAYIQVTEPGKLRMKIAQATEALREREEQFRRVAESASDAIISTDDEGVIVFWNQAAQSTFGYAPEEAIGRRFTDLAAPGSHDLLFANPDGHLVGALLSRQSGSDFPAELTSSSWMVGGKRYFTLIVRDVTERKRAEEDQAALRERYFHAQKMEAVGRLASGAAHEFNNVLNSLIANAEMAISEATPDSPAAPPLYEVLNCGWRAAEIVKQMQAFSDSPDEDAPALSPYTTINQLMIRLKAQLPKVIVLSEELEPSSSRITLDYDQFCRVVWNLFMNACKAMMPTGGTLTVALREIDLGDDVLSPAPQIAACDRANCSAHLMIGGLTPGRYVRLTVRDTGCGMSQETLSQAFEPFFTTAPVGSGSGMGLAMMHGVIQSRGGAIEVCSAPDKGTSFHVYLPALLHA